MIENCPMRHENGNCIPAGGFCTANKNICEALLNAYRMGKAQLSKESTTSDLISKTEAVEHLRRMLEATVPNTDYDEGFIDGVEFGISTVSTMPPIQPVATDTNVGNNSEIPNSSDAVSRQAAIDLVTDMEFMNFTAKGILRDSLRKLSPAQPELNLENLVRMIEFGITATNSRDAYSLGMRNGMRWCKSLIDGAEPKFEYGATRVDDGTDSADLPPAQPEPQEGHWIEGGTYRDVIECYCSECGQLMTTAATVRMNFCPNCGADMRGEKDG